MKRTLRNISVIVLRALGSTLVDAQSGEVIGRALLIPWRGRVLVLGLSGSHAVRPVFLPQTRLTYWKQELGFTVHPPPDFPRERDGDGNPHPSAAD